MKKELNEFLNDGDIFQLKRCVYDEVSEDAKCVLDSYEAFVEAISSCKKFEVIERRLQALNVALTEYDVFSDKNNYNLVAESERKFKNIYLNLKEEIKYILDFSHGNRKMCRIIEWCLKKRYLVQAITFYTEWMPLYIFDASIVTIIDQSIIEKCNQQKASYDPWQKFFLRRFRYTKSVNKIIQNDYMQINNFISNIAKMDSDARAKILLYMQDKNDKVGWFVREVCSVTNCIDRNNIVKSIKNMDSKNIIKRILQEACPSNNNFERFLRKRIAAENDIENVVFKAALNINKRKLQELLGIHSCDVKESVSVEDNVRSMIVSGAIATKLPNEDLIRFIQRYQYFVDYCRNPVNHAGNQNKNTNELIDFINDGLKIINLSY